MLLLYFIFIFRAEWVCARIIVENRHLVRDRRNLVAASVNSCIIDIELKEIGKFYSYPISIEFYWVRDLGKFGKASARYAQ